MDQRTDRADKALGEAITATLLVDALMRYLENAGTLPSGTRLALVAIVKVPLVQALQESTPPHPAIRWAVDRLDTLLPPAPP